MAGITSISVAGYKSLAREQTIEIRPLTILAGANSSGKSSIMQPLLLLKQTLESTFDPDVLRLDGPNAQFTSPDQLLSRIHGKQPAATFSVRLEMEGQPELQLNFKQEGGYRFVLDSMLYGRKRVYVGMPQEEARR